MKADQHPRDFGQSTASINGVGNWSRYGLTPVPRSTIDRTKLLTVGDQDGRVRLDIGTAIPRATSALF